jgi:hypothetical protein
MYEEKKRNRSARGASTSDVGADASEIRARS